MFGCTGCLHPAHASDSAAAEAIHTHCKQAGPRVEQPLTALKSKPVRMLFAPAHRVLLHVERHHARHVRCGHGRARLGLDGGVGHADGTHHVYPGGMNIHAGAPEDGQQGKRGRQVAARSLVQGKPAPRLAAWHGSGVQAQQACACLLGSRQGAVCFTCGQPALTSCPWASGGPGRLRRPR